MQRTHTHTHFQTCLHLNSNDPPFMSILVLCSLQEERKECAAYLFAGMDAGWLRPVVGSQYPLDQAAQAHHNITESPGAAGKIVLTM